MQDSIKCPQCGKDIAITEALVKQLQQDGERKFQQQIEAVKKQAQEDLVKQKQQLEQEKQNIKKDLWEKALGKAQEKFGLELKDFRAQVKEKEEKQKQMEEEILSERKRRRDIEEQAKKSELELEKKLEEEKEKIRQATEKEFSQEHRLKDLEKEKKINDLLKQLDEAKRKAQQGSQQSQGEVLELDLEKSLRETFSADIVEPIAKGVGGADIIQTVRNPAGKNCGTILYEVKQTKNWTEGWIAKFKDDLRKIKANIPVLVSVVLPKGIEGFAYYQGIWVVQPNFILALTVALRRNLIQVAFEKAASSGKGQKAELLYEYVASHEFRQKVEAIVEIYQDMQNQLVKERMAFEKSWQAREKQIQRLLINTAGMYGDMQGLVGSSMPEIKGLEIGDDQVKVEDGKKKEQTLF